MKTSCLPAGIMALLFLLMSFTAPAQSEKSDQLKEKIRAATEKMEKDLAELEKKREAGEINLEEYEDALEDILDDLEESVDKMETDLEEAFEWKEDEFFSMESDSNKNKINIKLGKKENVRRTKTYFLINVGPTDVLVNDENENVINPTYKPWRSWSGNVGMLFSTRLGGANSWVYVNYGLLWKFMYLETKDDVQLSLVDDEPEYITSPYASTLKHSQFSRQSLVLPVQLRFAGKGADAFNLMLGGYGGIRLYAFQDVEYKSEIGEEARLRLRDDYHTNLWNYGVTAAIGQRWWQLYADYELSNLFKDNPNYDYQVVNAGVQFFF